MKSWTVHKYEAIVPDVNKSNRNVDWIEHQDGNVTITLESPDHKEKLNVVLSYFDAQKLLSHLIWAIDGPSKESIREAWVDAS